MKHLQCCRYAIGALLLGGLLMSCSASDDHRVNLNPGEWEVTTRMEMPGMPTGMPPFTMRQCLGPDDFLPSQDSRQQGGDCEMTTEKISGDTVHWKVVCNNPEGKVVTRGSITYHGDSYEGEATIEAPGAPPMRQKMSGKRIGPCPGR